MKVVRASVPSEVHIWILSCIERGYIGRRSGRLRGWSVAGRCGTAAKSAGKGQRDDPDRPSHFVSSLTRQVCQDGLQPTVRGQSSVHLQYLLIRLLYTGVTGDNDRVSAARRSRGRH